MSLRNKLAALFSEPQTGIQKMMRPMTPACRHSRLRSKCATLRGWRHFGWLNGPFMPNQFPVCLVLSPNLRHQAHRAQVASGEKSLLRQDDTYDTDSPFPSRG